MYAFVAASPCPRTQALALGVLPTALSATYSCSGKDLCVQKRSLCSEKIFVIWTPVLTMHCVVVLCSSRSFVAISFRWSLEAECCPSTCISCNPSQDEFTPLVSYCWYRRAFLQTALLRTSSYQLARLRSAFRVQAVCWKETQPPWQSGKSLLTTKNPLCKATSAGPLPCSES